MGLRDRAITWFEGIIKEGVNIHNWDTIKAEFLETYEPKYSAKTTCANFTDLNKKSEDSINNYTYRVQTAYKCLTDNKPATMVRVTEKRKTNKEKAKNKKKAKKGKHKRKKKETDYTKERRQKTKTMDLHTSTKSENLLTSMETMDFHTSMKTAESFTELSQIQMGPSSGFRFQLKEICCYQNIHFQMFQLMETLNPQKESILVHL